MLYAEGTPITDVRGWDRSIKAVFHCPFHPENGSFRSKAPLSSTWFPTTQDDYHICDCQLSEFVLSEDYESK